jgi:hypothetical protein
MSDLGAIAGRKGRLVHRLRIGIVGRRGWRRRGRCAVAIPTLDIARQARQLRANRLLL